MNNQKEIDTFWHFMWKKGLPYPPEYKSNESTDSREERNEFLINIGRKCDELGISDPIETGLFNIQHFHPYKEDELEEVFGKLGFEDSYVKLFKDANLSLIRPSIHRRFYPISIFSDIIDGLQLDENEDYLFDPYYGMLIIKKDDGIRTLGIAMGSFFKYIQSIPEHFGREIIKNPSESLMTGVRFSQLLFKDLLEPEELAKLLNHQVPEIIVHSQLEYEELIGKIQNKNKQNTNLQIWFRGQTSDHLMPNRYELAMAGIIPYSNIQDSSLVPSLYRSIDKYVFDDSKYLSLVKHYGEWCLRAKLLFPPRYVVKRDGVIIDDPSFDIPEGCNAGFAMAFAGQPDDESQVVDDLGPYTVWTITNKDGDIVDTYTKHHFPGLAAYQANLVLQHYGCHTSALDITSNPKVAAWFATNKLIGQPDNLKTSPYEWDDKSKPNEWPTVFVMILVPGIHPFLNSAEILRDTGALRPIRQSCGLLSGSGNLCRNYGAKYICLKIRLAPEIKFNNLPDADFLFPDENEDKVLGSLLDFETKWGKEENHFPVYRVNHNIT